MTYYYNSCGYLPQGFAVGICRKNLSWLFVAGICRSYLSQKFAVAVCRGYLTFVFVSKSFYFVYVIKSCLNESKPFLYVGKTLFVIFSLLVVFLFHIAVAVMGHCKNVSNFCIRLVFHWIKI